MIKSLFLEIKNKLNDSDGYILLNMVLIFLVVLILILSVSLSAISNQKQAVKGQDYNTIYYYAESGLGEFIDTAIASVQNQSKQDQDDFLNGNVEYVVEKLTEWVLDQGLENTNTTIMNKTALRNIAIEVGDVDEEEFIITSTAHLGGETRTVQQSVFNFNGGGDEGSALGMCVVNAMTAKSRLDFSGSADIYGKVKLLDAENGIVNWGEVYIKDEVNADPDVKPNGFYHPRTSRSKFDVILPTTADIKRKMSENNAGIIPYINTYHPTAPKDEMPKSEMEPIPTENTVQITAEMITHNKESWEPRVGFMGELPLFNNTLVDLSKGDTVNYVASAFSYDLNGEHKELYIDVGDKDVVLLVNNIHLINNYIIVKGSGTLRVNVLKTEYKDPKGNKTKSNVLNPYGFYHEDAITMAKDNKNEFYEIEENKELFEKNQRYIADAKHKVSVIFHNENKNNIKTLVLNNETHALNNNRAFHSYNIISENYNIKFEAISSRNKIKYNKGLVRTSHFNVIAYGKVSVSFATSVQAGEGAALSDIYYVPEGTIDFQAQGFSGAMIADVIKVGNTGASLYFNVDVDGVLPPEFSIFDPSCSGDKPGIPGGGNVTGGMSFGPIREVSG